MPTKRLDKSTKNNIALLAAHGATVTKISKQTGLHHTSIKRALQEPSVIATREQIEKELSEMFMDTSRRAIQAISDEKLDKSNARDLGILAGVCLDKSRLITGQSTQNIAQLMASYVVEATRLRDTEPELTPER